MINKELSIQSNSKVLLLSLYHNSLSQKEEQYSDLNLFRRKIEEAKSGPHHKPYDDRKSQSFLYRSIFAGLGLLFLALTYFIYQQSLTWQCNLVFGSCHLIKTLLCGVTFSLSAVAFFVSYSIRPEKEAVHFIGLRAKQKLDKMFQKSQSTLGWKQFFDVERKLILRHAKDKVNEGIAVTIALMKRISADSSMKKEEKATLYNQAVLELNDSLQHILHDFGAKLSKG